MTRKKDEVTIRVQPNNFSKEILIFIPHDLWDATNLADGIKKAVLMTVAQLPDNLDS